MPRNMPFVQLLVGLDFMGNQQVNRSIASDPDEGGDENVDP